MLVQAIRDGLALLTWQSDTFAYAESYDEAAARYRGLRGGQVVSLSPTAQGCWSSRTWRGGRWMPRFRRLRPVPDPVPGLRLVPVRDRHRCRRTAQLRRFHGTVSLDPARVGRDASRIADEVIAHLAGQVGAEVTVTLEIEARLPGGASDQIVRTVTENSRTLKFTSHGFESE